jgi:hypothetical protein
MCKFYRLCVYIQERQWKYNRNIEERSSNHGCRGKAVSVTYSVCMSVALII